MSKKIETEFGTAKIYNGYYRITSKKIIRNIYID